MNQETMANEWLESDKKELNLSLFKALGELIFTKKEAIDEVKKQLKVLEDELQEHLRRAEELMNEAGLEKQHIPNHGTLFFREYARLSAPKEIADKQRLWDYFKKRGIAWEMFSVNSQTLNSYYNAEREALEGEAKLNFTLDGCGQPNVYRALQVRKGK
jgi:hypothetical protein